MLAVLNSDFLSRTYFSSLGNFFAYNIASEYCCVNTLPVNLFLNISFIIMFVCPSI